MEWQTANRNDSYLGGTKR